MEQHNAGGEHQPPHYPLPDSQDEAGRSELAREVDVAIENARLLEQSIDDLTAKRIAADIQPGSGALYDFATTGQISEDIYTELEVAREVLAEAAHTWVAALEDYCLGSGERGVVASWADLDNTRPTDEQRIYHGITEALCEQRPIDHGTARTIAAQLHGGQASALSALASTGAITDGLQAELENWRQHEDTPITIEPWLDALDEYITSRTDNLDPIAGWHTLWAPQPERGEEDADNAETERPPYGTTGDVGRAASGAVVEQPRDNLRDIPKLETYADCDGYGWVERLPAGWHAVPSWGLYGWDLARWPYSIVAIYDNSDTESYAFGIYTEGDIAVMRLPSRETLHEAVDDLAEWYWRNGVALGPDDMPTVQGLLPHHCGPFSLARLTKWEREQDRLHGH